MGVDNTPSFKIDGVYCRLVSLTQGQHAIVDASDFEQIVTRKWSARWNRKTKSFYAISNSFTVDGKRHTLHMHREILGLKRGDKLQGDHENHVTLDNRRKNLRASTQSQNQCNSGKRRTNTSGYKGVYWYKKLKKWKAQIQLNKKNRHIGYFETKEAAYVAYCEEAKRLHGEFAKLN